MGSPETGRSLHYAKENGRLYVCAKAGLFYSDDDGLSWNTIATPPSISTANEVYVVNSVIYLFTRDDYFLGEYPYNLVRSKDNGQSWKNIYPFKSVSFTFHSPLIKGDTILLFADDSIAISTDNGDHYNEVKCPLTSLTKIVFHGDKILGVRDETLYESDDLGLTWTALYQTPSGYFGMNILSDGPDLYAFFHGDEGMHYVFRSTNDGFAWTMQGGFFDIFLLFPAFFGENGSYYVFRSSPGNTFFHSHTECKTWNEFINEPKAYDFTFIDTTLYARNVTNIQYSKDHGDTFETHTKGFFAADVTGLAVAGDNQWVQADQKVYKRSSSTEWAELSFIETIQSSADGNLLGFVENELKRSSDHGSSWIPILPSVFNLTSFNNFPRNVFAAGNLFIVDLKSGIWLSHDRGVTWEPFDLLNALDHGIAHAGGDSSHYIVTDYFKNILVSDNGVDWENVTYDLTLPGTRPFNMVHAHNGYYFVGTGKKTYRLFPGHMEWELLQYPFTATYPHSPAVTFNSMVSDGEVLLGSSYGHGIFRSSDNGSTWEPVNESLMDYQVNVLKSDGTRLWAGIDGGVWVRELDEITTALLNPEKDSYPIAVSPNPAQGLIQVGVPNAGFRQVKNVSVTDLNGQILQTMQEHGNTFELNIDSYPAGIYILWIQTSSGNARRLFTKI